MIPILPPPVPTFLFRPRRSDPCEPQADLPTGTGCVIVLAIMTIGGFAIWTVMMWMMPSAAGYPDDVTLVHVVHENLRWVFSLLRRVW